VGGWRKFGAQLKAATVYLHPSALELKYQEREDHQMELAGDRHFGAAMRESASGFVELLEPMEVLPGIWATGQVPRWTDFEDTGGRFFAGRDAAWRDTVPDDLSLFFRTSAGLVVILGCAHAGVINILRYCIELTEERIHAVVGGMHLLHASETRMAAMLEALDEIAPDWLAPNHCTGDAAVAELYGAFPGKVLEFHAGQSFSFPLSVGGED
jgi:7,8-dihydropterin-6-yl-methyl-4-(beta-D-ribofuranosyl)aminobenzene 5'-phosphate synthase